jgi:hypothetical protein
VILSDRPHIVQLFFVATRFAVAFFTTGTAANFALADHTCVLGKASFQVLPAFVVCAVNSPSSDEALIAGGVVEFAHIVFPYITDKKNGEASSPEGSDVISFMPA